MKPSHACLGAISIVLSQVTTPAAEAAGPLLVSPGLLDEFAVQPWPCPTFSWASEARGEAQELVVYEVDESGAILADPTLALRLPALATSWTPSAAECFGRGKSYAWSLRAIGDEAGSEWGATRFFSIPAGPSEEEFLAGLEIVKAYLALEGQDPRHPEGNTANDRGGVEGDGAEAKEVTSLSETKIRTARAGAVNRFRVSSGGAVEAASFTGDGSALTGIGQAAIATNGVGPSEIAANAVDADEILDGSVGAAEIGTNAVGADEIATGAVGAEEIAAQAVGASEIVAGAVGASEMAGNFCLVRRGGYACPAGYTEYTLTWDTEDTENADSCTESVAQWCGVSSAPSFIILAFCCA